jgi:hypothetical protein
MLSATIAVLKAKEIKPCIQVNRRTPREVTSTSDTWKVMPTTKEK